MSREEADGADDTSPSTKTGAGETAGAAHNHGARTPAQWYGYIFGVALLLLGLLGFTADANFDTEATDLTSGGFQGDGFLGFEVNGTHNVVHLASGLLLLALAPKRGSARVGAVGFGILYVLVTLVGVIDGDNVLGLIPVNGADNVLHAALAVLGLGAGLASPRAASR